MFFGREAVIMAIKEKYGAIGQRHERVVLGGIFPKSESVDRGLSPMPQLGS